MTSVKVSALKRLIKQHEQKCHRKYGASWRAESILRRILETFCVDEVEDEVTLMDGWYDFLIKRCVPKSFIGQLCVRKFNCLEAKNGNT